MFEIAFEEFKTGDLLPFKVEGDIAEGKYLGAVEKQSDGFGVSYKIRLSVKEGDAEVEKCFFGSKILMDKITEAEVQEGQLIRVTHMGKVKGKKYSYNDYKLEVDRD